jgi:hypothetical protein
LEYVDYGSEKDKHTCHATIPQYPVVEEKLLRWIDALCRKNCTLYTSIVSAKAKEVGHIEVQSFLGLAIQLSKAK